MDMLKNGLSDNVVQHIGNISIRDENLSDYAIWNLTQDNLYSNISAGQSIREVRQKDLFLGKIIKAAISTAFQNCDITSTWAQLCARIERDATVDLIMAFAVPTQCKTNNQAEALAALYVTRWCKQAGYNKYDLELDSIVAANMIKDKYTNNLKLKGIIRDTIQAMRREGRSKYFPLL
ncbi:hypothetical protein HAX54_024732 [Datura stramonium]|uniref:RNase H type-1 domain-containing protein n=1 Tax=Datura stramonium TaxID=4076 RepID=A0ABS8RK31_DATST|nr:hypothetical protein [Datura stramonium]